MDKDIDQLVQNCKKCQQAKPMPPKAPLHPWQWLSRPWSCIHVDFAGPIQGKTFLIGIDSHFNWLEVPYRGLFSQGANFPKRWALSFSRNFPDSKIPEPGTLIKSRDQHSTKFYGSIVVCAIASRSPCNSLYYYHSMAMCYKVATRPSSWLLVQD